MFDDEPNDIFLLTIYFQYRCNVYSYIYFDSKFGHIIIGKLMCSRMEVVCCLLLRVGR
jgi:hypothetical protein